MVSGKIADLKRYYSLHPAMEFIDKFMQEYMAEPKPDGGYEIIPGRLKATVSSYETGKAEEKRFEAHKKFADVQVIVKGAERIDWADLSVCTDMLSEEYSKGGDIAFYAEPKFLSKVTLKTAMFMVMFPEDAHKPCVMAGNTPEAVTKIVFKVLL